MKLFKRKHLHLSTRDICYLINMLDLEIYSIVTFEWEFNKDTHREYKRLKKIKAKLEAYLEK